MIATVRADFWHRAAEIPELIALAEGQGRIDLAAPSGPELAEMIHRPAQAAGLSFEVHPETGLRLDAVLAEDAAAAPGALPLISFTLDELYKNAKARGATVLTYASYEALGGLEGAIAKRADRLFQHPPGHRQSPRRRHLTAFLAPVLHRPAIYAGRRSSSGSLAVLAAMRRASSRGRRCAAARRPGSSSK